jgi:hypothetical protein
MTRQARRGLHDDDPHVDPRAVTGKTKEVFDPVLRPGARVLGAPPTPRHGATVAEV